MIRIVPSASTWSRARHSGLAGQHPLRSRSSPLGLSSLSLDDSEKIHHANRELEIIAWVAEQALHCPSKLVGLTLIFPEDLGGHISDGPSSLWALREFQFLEGTRDARRAACYLCQFTRADYKRPIGVFSNCIHLRDRLSLGWPSFKQVQDRLVYKDPLLLRCSCGHSHSLLLVSRKTPRFGLRRLLGLALTSGAHVSTTIRWKGDSVPLGMAINLISLLCFGIRSFFFAVYVRSVESGYFVEIVARRYCASRSYCSLFLRVSWIAFLSLDFALPVEGFYGSSPCKFSEGPTGSCYHVVQSALAVALTYKKAPGPSATEGRCFIRGDWRSSWFAESQVCSAHSVPLLMMFLLFFSVL